MCSMKACPIARDSNQKIHMKRKSFNLVKCAKPPCFALSNATDQSVHMRAYTSHYIFAIFCQSFSIFLSVVCPLAILFLDAHEIQHATRFIRYLFFRVNISRFLLVINAFIYIHTHTCQPQIVERENVKEMKRKHRQRYNLFRET